MRRFTVLAALFLLATVASLRAPAAEGTLQSGDYVAVIGDSITEQRLYSIDIEEYLLMCESAKYPFCFYGDPAQPGATRGAIEFIPFNDELNRFQLVVRGLGAEKAKVTWGNATKEFSADQLAKGINLAAEFLDNPFSEPFRKVEERISGQQAMEVRLVRTLVHNLPDYQRLFPEERESLDHIANGLVGQDRAAQTASAAAVVPVKHTMKITPVN
jgi:hypothetical protein